MHLSIHQHQGHSKLCTPIFAAVILSTKSHTSCVHPHLCCSHIVNKISYFMCAPPFLLQSYRQQNLILHVCTPIFAAVILSTKPHTSCVHPHLCCSHIVNKTSYFMCAPPSLLQSYCQQNLILHVCTPIFAAVISSTKSHTSCVHPHLCCSHIVNKISYFMCAPPSLLQSYRQQNLILHVCTPIFAAVISSTKSHTSCVHPHLCCSHIVNKISYFMCAPPSLLQSYRQQNLILHM